MKKKTAVITGLTVTGVAALVGAGVALKKRKKKKGNVNVEKLVDDYNDNHGNGRLSSSKKKGEDDEEEHEQSRKYIMLKKFTNQDLSQNKNRD